MDRFFTQTRCDRCGGSLNSGRIMSAFNEECLCIICKEHEVQDKDYQKAVEAERMEIRRGNYNFKGIRG